MDSSSIPAKLPKSHPLPVVFVGTDDRSKDQNLDSPVKDENELETVQGYSRQLRGQEEFLEGSTASFEPSSQAHTASTLVPHLSEARPARSEPIDPDNSDFCLLRQCLGLTLPENHTTGATARTFPQSIDDSIFVAADCEAWEVNRSIVTEVGIASLDTRDLRALPPTLDVPTLISKITYQHFLVDGTLHHINKVGLKGCPLSFNFGKSEVLPLKDLPRAIHECFTIPDDSLPENQENRQAEEKGPTPPNHRPIILVGHFLDEDIKYLSLAHYPISRASSIVAHIDTLKLSHVLGIPFSVGKLAHLLHLHPTNLHNAGNDAGYTLHILLSLALHAASRLAVPQYWPRAILTPRARQKQDERCITEPCRPVRWVFAVLGHRDKCRKTCSALVAYALALIMLLVQSLPAAARAAPRSSPHGRKSKRRSFRGELKYRSNAFAKSTVSSRSALDTTASRDGAAVEGMEGVDTGTGAARQYLKKEKTEAQRARARRGRRRRRNNKVNRKGRGVGVETKGSGAGRDEGMGGGDGGVAGVGGLVGLTGEQRAWFVVLGERRRGEREGRGG